MTTNPNQQTEKLAFEILKEKYGDRIQFRIEREQKECIYKKTQRYLNDKGICFDFNYKEYYRAVDGILLKEGIEKLCEIKSLDHFTFVEVKSTRRKLDKLPYGAWFAFTQNEEKLLNNLPNYELCIVQVKKQRIKFLNKSKYDKLCKTVRDIHYITIKKEQ